MPIYLVRWPDMSASLVQAEDRDDLVRRLDEVADPGGCTWEEYKGKLWVDFVLPVGLRVRDDSGDRPVSESDVEIDPAQLAGDPWRMDLAVPDGDTGTEMLKAIRAGAFPNLNSVLDASGGEDIERQELEMAIRRDLAPMIQYSWRYAQVQRQDGPEAELMRELGVTTPVDKIYRPRQEDEGDEED